MVSLIFLVIFSGQDICGFPSSPRDFQVQGLVNPPEKTDVLDTLWWTNSLQLKMAIYNGFSH